MNYFSHSTGSFTSRGEQNTIRQVSVSISYSPVDSECKKINIVLSCSHRNLPFEISTEEMYDIFGKFGAIRQIRL